MYQPFTHANFTTFSFELPKLSNATTYTRGCAHNDATNTSWYYIFIRLGLQLSTARVDRATEAHGRFCDKTIAVFYQVRHTDGQQF